MNEQINSFITKNGGLNVSINASDVNWFNFLLASRTTNSVKGGWNSKTFWWERGTLQLLSINRDIIHQWTANSFRNPCANTPRPRTKRFMFDRPHSRERTNLEGAINVDDSTENELNWAIFNEKLARFKDIELKGYEIPLAEDSEGQLKVDLFGLSSNPDAIEIIEIKKAKNHSDSPLLAFAEAICYALQAIRCKEYLRKELCCCLAAFTQINLKILAPQKYWKYWGCIDGATQSINNCETCFSQILDTINRALDREQIDSKVSVQLGLLSHS